MTRCKSKRKSKKYHIMQIYVLELIGDKAQRESFNMQIKTSFLENICTCIKEPKMNWHFGDGKMNSNSCSCRLMGPGSPATERVAGTPGHFSHAGLALSTALSVRRRHKDSGLQGLRRRSWRRGSSPGRGVVPWGRGAVPRGAWHVHFVPEPGSSPAAPAHPGMGPC